MSSRNLVSDTMPIPINYTKSYHGFSDPPNSCNKYLFCLELGMKDESVKNFNKIEDNKYSYIIDIDDEINYNDIVNFNIFVSELPFNGNNYTMYGKIDQTLSTFTQKDENFYVEFSQDTMGKALCTCYFIGVDFNTMFVSPPN
jgi:hypothetical protein